MEPKTIHLKDYRPAPFSIDTIQLEVDIHSDHTIVASELKMIKREAGKTNLELFGEGLELQEIKFNGEILPSSAYQVSNEKLVLLNVEKEAFTLNIKVKIDPATNKALEGFYQSGPQLCTQCEPEGFRKITYYLDRPDVMAKFKTKMIGDKKQYPYLLSNGNKIGSGDLPQGRHWIEWEDPFKKPSYLFAMVAGDFDIARDSFT